MSSLQLLDLGATTLLHSLLWPAAVALCLCLKRDLRPEHRAGLLKLALFGALITGPWASLRGGPSLLDSGTLAPDRPEDVLAQVEVAEVVRDTASEIVADPEFAPEDAPPLFISVLSLEELIGAGAIEIEAEAGDVALGAPRVGGATVLQDADDARVAEREAHTPASGAAAGAPDALASFTTADLFPWIARASLAAFALLALSAAWRQWRARRWLGHLPGCDREEEQVLAERLEALERRAGRRPRARLVVSPALPVPCTWGLRKPVIGVPERALDELEAGELDAVLAHELAHVARRDAWWHAGVQTLLALAPLHWPARRAARALARATELSADAWAARLTGSPLDLAGGLTKVAGWTRGARVPVPALAMAAQPSLVSERVEALLDRRPLVAPRELAPFALGALLIAGASAPRVWAEDRAAQSNVDPAPHEPIDAFEWREATSEPSSVRVDVALPQAPDLATWIADQRSAAQQVLGELRATAGLAAASHPEVLPRLHALEARVERHLEHLNTAATWVAADDHPEPRKRRR